MRAPGEVRLALLKSATELTTPAQSPTMRELAAHARVGLIVTRETLKNMVRAEILEIVRRRAVAHSKKPVAEYAPKEARIPERVTSVMSGIIADWGRST